MFLFLGGYSSSRPAAPPPPVGVIIISPLFLLLLFVVVHKTLAILHHHAPLQPPLPQYLRLVRLIRAKIHNRLQTQRYPAREH